MAGRPKYEPTESDWEAPGSPQELAPVVRLRGGQSRYRPAIADKICHLIATTTKGLRAICEEEPDLPDDNTVRRWLDTHQPFAQAYARARDAQADLLAYQIISISDTPEIGERVDRKRIGWQCSGCGLPAKWHSSGFEHMDGSALCEKAQAEPVIEEKRITGDNVERSKARIGARQWLAARLAPRKYGDRTALDQRFVDEGGKDRPFTLEDYRQMVEAARKVRGEGED
jgi:hypothetical protein